MDVFRIRKASKSTTRIDIVNYFSNSNFINISLLDLPSSFNYLQCKRASKRNSVTLCYFCYHSQNVLLLQNWFITRNLIPLLSYLQPRESSHSYFSLQSLTQKHVCISLIIHLHIHILCINNTHSIITNEIPYPTKHSVQIPR